MESIEHAATISGKRVLLRVDFNVAIENGKVADDFRIRRSLQTIEYLKGRGAKVILLSHIGRNRESLLPIYEHLKSFVGLSFIPELLGPRVETAISKMVPGDVLLLENVRRDPRENLNDPVFAKQLAFMGDCYVNDAFSASHREHASIVGIPKYIKGYAGILFQEEVEALSKALSPQGDSLFILGGAKFETKVPLIRKFLNSYSRVFVGGAIANDFFKAKGFSVGKSLVSAHAPDLHDMLENPKLILPEDVLVLSGERVSVKAPNDVENDETIVDSGPKTREVLAGAINASAFILWNGPLGNYEKGFSEETNRLARAIAAREAVCIVGGGDTVAAIAHLNLEQGIAFVSTGGGAMLEFLLSGTLPGIEALSAGYTHA